MDNIMNAEMIPRQRLKIISLGDLKSGKSCIIRRFCEGRFLQRYVPTIGVDYGVKQLKMKAREDQFVEVDIDFWDFSGDKDYVNVRKEFYENVDGAFMVFDVGNLTSFKHVQIWLNEANENGLDTKRVAIVLCGSKTDSCPRRITLDQGKKLSQAKGLTYFETSSFTGLNIEKMILFLCQEALNRRVKPMGFT